MLGSATNRSRQDRSRRIGKDLMKEPAVEPQPPSSSTPQPSPAAQPSPPPPASPGGGASAPAPPPNPEIVICPACRGPPAEDARFCEERGHDYGADTPPPPVPEERPMFSGPVLWAIMLFWIAIAIGGLFFLYNALWAL